MEFIARYRQSDGTPQSLKEHLEGVAQLAARFSDKIGLPICGELLGLQHDMGKYPKIFQNYIRSAEGKIEPDDDDFIDARKARGKIDHSSAGAQFIWRESGKSPFHQVAANIMALCIASHHSGLIDCLAPDGTDVFTKRMDKADGKTHFKDAMSLVEEEIGRRARALLVSNELAAELKTRLDKLREIATSPETGQFMLGFMTRFLFSALIDADRLHSAERTPADKMDWPPLVSRLEEHLAKFTAKNRIDEIRGEISQACLKCAERGRGLYRLTVPTGGGKTLASLRFALHHAAKHGMDRILYVVPYTSIIDQNARVARSVFAPIEAAGRQVVLEHHSNLTPEQDTNESKLLSENWDSPIIYTTAVQFLETLFAAGTRGVRRLHQLANAVIIFDEIQTVPVPTVHIFNNAINFLVNQGNSTVVFCTATQPLLDQVDTRKGAAILSENAEMMPNVEELFRDLHRARIEDLCKDGGWSDDEIAQKVTEELAGSGSVLIVVNKKAQARELFKRLSGTTEHVYHLSTSMCPAHRMAVLDKIKAFLDPARPQPVICVSTQLIEAGVDVDFGSVIRYLAGLDSVAQAAGRCNRHGRRNMGRVLVINPANENLDSLVDIRSAQEVSRRVLHEFRKDPDSFDQDLQSPAAMARFYEYHFFQRAHEMAFPLSPKEIGRNDDLLSLLSANTQSVQIYQHEHRKAPPLHLRQSFMSAAKAFKAIDSPTEGVIVPYDEEGKRIIAELFSLSRFDDKSRLLKEAQRYSVNLFPHEKKKLMDKQGLSEVWAGSGIYCLGERYYSEEFGVGTDVVAPMAVLSV